MVFAFLCSDGVLTCGPVSYRYIFEDLLALLHGHAPAKVDAVALHRRRVEHGHLSVGLKIHCLGDGSQFSTLVEGLGGAQKILDVNYYKHWHASLCLVLPPVGSARSAILLLECIEHFLDLRFSVTRKSSSSPCRSIAEMPFLPCALSRALVCRFHK
jgi:hypothetical protein